jgi:hypothetical protein
VGYLAETQVVPFQILTTPVIKPVEFLTLTWPVAKSVPFQTFTGLITVMLRLGVFVEPVTFVALITKVKTPGVVGVPEITPVEVFSVIPLGSAPENTE